MINITTNLSITQKVYLEMNYLSRNNNVVL